MAAWTTPYPVSVPVGRGELVKVAGPQMAALDEGESRHSLHGALVQPAKDPHFLLAPVQSDEATGEVVVHRRLGSRRQDGAAEATVARPVEQVGCPPFPSHSARRAARSPREASLTRRAARRRSAGAPAAWWERPPSERSQLERSRRSFETSGCCRGTRRRRGPLSLPNRATPSSVCGASQATASAVERRPCGRRVEAVFMSSNVSAHNQALTHHEERQARRRSTTGMESSTARSTRCSEGASQPDGGSEAAAPPSDRHCS